MTEKTDVYTRVTNKILADLERGNLTCTSHGRPAIRPGRCRDRCAPAAKPTAA